MEIYDYRMLKKLAQELGPPITRGACAGSRSRVHSETAPPERHLFAIDVVSLRRLIRLPESHL